MTTYREKTAISIAVVLCLLLFFSCTTTIDFPPPQEKTKLYCVYPATKECYLASNVNCPLNGELTEGCPYSSSSSSLGDEDGSSSSVGSARSSSSVALPEYAVCVYDPDGDSVGTCLNGPFTSCPLVGGHLSNTCPYNSPPSSSSAEPSSSSAEPSSSSADLPSSSSADLPSSSSEEPPSSGSGSLPSSSSADLPS